MTRLPRLIYSNVCRLPQLIYSNVYIMYSTRCHKSIVHCCHWLQWQFHWHHWLQCCFHHHHRLQWCWLVPVVPPLPPAPISLVQTGHTWWVLLLPLHWQLETFLWRGAMAGFGVTIPNKQMEWIPEFCKLLRFDDQRHRIVR